MGLPRHLPRCSRIRLAASMVATSSNPSAERTISPHLILKVMSVLLLYVLLGHPSIYPRLWEQRNWYVLALLPVVGPLLLVTSIRMLVWRVRLGCSAIRIRSVVGVVEHAYSEITHIERVPGQLRLTFQNGTRKVIPSLIGDLDQLRTEIERRRGGERHAT
jgi:hypothetical protein